jgi:hypothetical protein
MHIHQVFSPTVHFQVCEKIRKMWLQDEDATIRCWFRYMFLPPDVADSLINADPVAFDYLYTQVGQTVYM